MTKHERPGLNGERDGRGIGNPQPAVQAYQRTDLRSMLLVARHNPRISVIAAGPIAMLCAALLCTGCGGSQITASTMCKDYLAQSEESRHDAAVRISSETRGVNEPGNPMWGLSLDAACGSDPNMTVGQYFARDSGAPAQRGTSAQTETSSAPETSAQAATSQVGQLSSDSNCADWYAARVTTRKAFAGTVRPHVALTEPVPDDPQTAQAFMYGFIFGECERAKNAGLSPSAVSMTRVLDADFPGSGKTSGAP